STTPEATRAAIESLPEHGTLFVILGGHDRGVDWSGFARFAAGQNRLHCFVQGDNGPRIVDQLRAGGVESQHLSPVDDLAQAVDCARAKGRPGDTLLLSPGAPSFDQFDNYAERGRYFARRTGFDDTLIGRIHGLGIR